MQPLHLPTVRRLLSGGQDKLPATLEGEFPNVVVPPYPGDTYGHFRVGTFDFQIRPSSDKPARKSSQHRVYVKCGNCGKYVPAGRLHQHEPACKR